MPSANFSHLVTNPKMKKVLEECGYIRSNTLGQHWELKPRDWHGCCTSGPTTFYKNGGIQLYWWGGAGPYKANVEQMRSSLKKAGMVEVFHCNLVVAKEKFTRANSKINCRPGDIASMLSETSAHGVMWTGEDWRSDTIEPDHPVPYPNTKGGRGGDESFILWRHPDLQEPGVPIDGGALGGAPGGAGASSSTGNSSFGGNMAALNGISKYWYLGAAHNILNNAQLEKLYVDVKLRGCNLSILKGEKVPVLLIDNKHKTNLAEPDAAHIDPTTMMDTWASGWFMVGGISYIYDPKSNGNANKWTTHMKLQRMEWPTPVEVTDPSARNVRSLRYNLADGIEGLNIDAGVTVEGTSANDAWKSKEIVVGTAGLDSCMKQLLKLFDVHKIRYKLVSARRYPIDEFGNIVKEKKPANVKWQGSYAFKCADGVRFFRNPISDHSWGQGIDIIQAPGTNFNKLLADILDCDDILVFMYNNGLSLYEEQAVDDLGAATSHFHIGTNINLPTSGGKKVEDIITIGNNWWDGVAAIKGSSILKGYALSKWKNKKKPSVTDKIPDDKIWTLRKIFNDEKDWQTKSFNKREISYDDWIAKVEVNLKKEIALYNSEKEDVRVPNIPTGTDGKNDSGSVLQTDDPNAYVPSIPRGAEPGSVKFDDIENKAYENFKLSNREAVDESTWDSLGDECYTRYSEVERLFNNSVKPGTISVADAHFQDAVAYLRECMGKIKSILNIVDTGNLIWQLETEDNLDIENLLIKRYNLETKYNNSKKLCSDIDKYMQIYNANYIKGLSSENNTESNTGVKTVTLLNTENAQKLPLEDIMKDIELCHQVYNEEKTKINNLVHCYSINTHIWYDTRNKVNTYKFPKAWQFLRDFIQKSGINPWNVLICDPLSDINKWTISTNYTSQWATGGNTVEGKLANEGDEGSTISIYIYDDPGKNTNQKKWEQYVINNDLSDGHLIIAAWTIQNNIPFSIDVYEWGMQEMMEDLVVNGLLGWFEVNKKIWPSWVWKYKKLLNEGAFDNITQDNWHNSGVYQLWFDIKSKIKS